MISLVTASEKERAQAKNSGLHSFRLESVVFFYSRLLTEIGGSFLERNSTEGDTPVPLSSCLKQSGYREEGASLLTNESCCLRVQHKTGGILHLRLNIHEKPIANKYCEGKMKSTLKRESKELEIVKIELI